MTTRLTKDGRKVSGVVLFAVVVALAAIGKGRLWCNWVCPAGAIEVIPRLERKNVHMGHAMHAPRRKRGRVTHSSRAREAVALLITFPSVQRDASPLGCSPLEPRATNREPLSFIFLSSARAARMASAENGPRLAQTGTVSHWFGCQMKFTRQIPQDKRKTPCRYRGLAHWKKFHEMTVSVKLSPHYAGFHESFIARSESFAGSGRALELLRVIMAVMVQRLDGRIAALDVLPCLAAGAED